MYDIYLNGSTFAVGTSKLPKHKGVLAITSTAQNGLTAWLVNQQGNTVQAAFYLPAGSNILPHQFYAVTAMATGCTAFLLN